MNDLQKCENEDLIVRAKLFYGKNKLLKHMKTPCGR